MASRGYVQQIHIPDGASTDDIVKVVNEAFKTVYLANILPYFPKWYLLRVATQLHPGGDVKKGVPCLLVPTDKIDYLTLTRCLSFLSPSHDYLIENGTNRCLNGTAVRGAGPGFKNLVFLALKPPNKDLPLSQDQGSDEDSSNEGEDNDNKVRYICLLLKA
jgi:hypothetical protein